jgi:hypothetical protein
MNDFQGHLLPRNLQVVSGGGSNVDPNWATQAAWYINASTGNDNNSGASSGTAIKSWTELRRRILLVGGFTNPAGTSIYIQTSLPDTDAMDTSGMFSFGIGYITVYGTTSVVRTGTITAYTPRNTGTNQTNVLTDSSVSSWGSDIGVNTGHLLMMTSGLANGVGSYVIKDLGSHQARMSTFLDVLNTGNEIQPSVNDTYQIVSCPFIRNFYIDSPNTGVWFFYNLNLGDNSSTLYGVGIAQQSYLEFYYCAVFIPSINNTSSTDFNSCASKFSLSAYSSQVIFEGGVMQDITGYSGPFCEIEDAGEFSLSGGIIFQGVQLFVANGGYSRIYDAGFFDTVTGNQAAVVCGLSMVRAELLWGSNNVNYGVTIGAGGEFYYWPAGYGGTPGCTIAGTINNVWFMEVPYSWTAISTAGYLRAQGCNASISNYGLQTEIGVQNTDNLVNIVTSVNLATTGQTALLLNLPSNAVPTGKTFVLTDIKIVPTTVTSLTIAPSVSVGISAGYNTWAPITALTGLNTVGQMMSLAQSAAAAIRTTFAAGSVPKFDVTTAATATALTVSLHILGYFY